MQHRLLTGAFAVMTCLAACTAQPARSSRESAPPCMPPDSYATGEIAGLKQIMAATDSPTVTFRTSSSIPVVADSAVELVSSPPVCKRALSIFNGIMKPNARATSLYVIRLGSRYTAARPDSSGNEWTNWIVMDDRFTIVGSYLR